MKKHLIVLQNGPKDCGACSLLSVIRYYDGNISLNKLSELTNTTKDGTNFYYLKEAGEKMGIHSKSFKLDNVEILNNIRCPILCQLIQNNYHHFVVVYEIKGNKITIMDPAKGSIVMSTQEFSEFWTGYIMIFEPVKKVPFFVTSNHLKELIVETLFSNYKILLNVFLLSLIYIIFTGILSFYLQIIIDKVFGTSTSNLTTITIIFIFLSIIKVITNYFRSYLLEIINMKIDITIVMNVYKKILTLPYFYYKNKTTGETISRLNDLSYIRNLISEFALNILMDGLLAVSVGIILILTNFSLFIISLIFLLFYLIIALVFKRILKVGINNHQENTAKVNSYLYETINGFETVKGLNVENNTIDKFEYLYSKTLNNIFKLNLTIQTQNFLKELVSIIGTLLITYLGSKMVMENILTLGSLLTFNTLIIYFMDPLKNILDLDIKYYYAKNSFNRVNNFYEVETEDLNKESNLIINGNITFNNIRYSYNKKDFCLDNISLNIKNKEKVLILGSSGTGKSTLLKLLYKYHEIERNMLYINNIDINDYYLSDIRKNICYISQNETLYTDSVYENIILERNISHEEFLNACKLCEVDKVIENKALGYNTLIEENGSNFSGGERQRIILARSILKSSNILLIDEGLNELDINSERRILKNIFEYYRDKTIIIVSHRHINMDLFDKVINLTSNNVVIKERSLKYG